MKEKLKKFYNKIKNWIFKVFIEGTGCIDDPIDPLDESLEKKQEQKIIEKIQTKKYISRNRAIQIADEEQNLRKSMYKEAKKAGFDYALIEIIDYYATLVIFQKKYAWYVKISECNYNKAEGKKYFKGYYDEYSNIGCLIMAETGEYIYLGKDCDTRYFRMTTDDEYLEYIHNVRQ